MSGIIFSDIFMISGLLVALIVLSMPLALFLWDKHVQPRVRRKALLGSMVTYSGGSFGPMATVFIHVPINGERDLTLDLLLEKCSVSRPRIDWYNYYKAEADKGVVPMGLEWGVSPDAIGRGWLSEKGSAFIVVSRWTALTFYSGGGMDLNEATDLYNYEKYDWCREIL